MSIVYNLNYVVYTRERSRFPSHLYCPSYRYFLFNSTYRRISFNKSSKTGIQSLYAEPSTELKARIIQAYKKGWVGPVLLVLYLAL